MPECPGPMSCRRPRSGWPLPALVLATLALVTPAAQAQPAALDVLDGETLYDGGWLVSLGRQTERRERLRSGWSSVADPLARRATFEDRRLSLHHGLRHDLQLSLLLPWVRRELRLAPAGGPVRRLVATSSHIEYVGDVFE